MFKQRDGGLNCGRPGHLFILYRPTVYVFL